MPPVAKPTAWRSPARGPVATGAALLLLLSLLCALPAGAQFGLVRTWDGPYGYVAGAATLRTQSNTAGGTNPSCQVTSGSTSVTVSGIPSGAVVDAAYLYWAGSGPTDATVTFAGSSVTADRTTTDTYFFNGNTLEFFGGVKDVTGRITGNGTVSFSGLTVSTGNPYCNSGAVLGGWGVLVVYRQTGAAPRRIQLRDGFFTLRQASETINLSGFVGASTPSVQLTYLVYEGDPDQSGDGTTPERVYWNGSQLGSGNNAFNSTVPGNANAHGVDMATYTPSLAAGATSATFTTASGTDLVLPQFVVTSIAVAPRYGVTVTPDGLATPTRRLPGTDYPAVFKVVNTSNQATVFDLLLGGSGNPLFATLDSLRGPGVATTTRPDSARLSLAFGDSAFVTFWYSVAPGDTATNTGTLRARAVPLASVFDDGFQQVRRVRPSLTLSKSVTPSATLSPGTDLAYTLSLANAGEYDARGVTVTDAVPPQVEFKLGSLTQTLPAGITSVAAFSSDGGTTWTYTPVSQGCGAPVGYDRCVNRVRWTLSGDLPPGVSASSLTLGFVARIR